MTTAKLADIKFDPAIYPRKQHSPALVQRYSACLPEIEAHGNLISIAADGRLIDGRHRHLAYLTAYAADTSVEIPVIVYDIAEDDALFDLATELNSTSGDQLSEDDKRRAAIRMYGRANRKPQEDIARALAVGKNKISTWLKAIVDQEREEREARIWQMWLACHTLEAIAQDVKVQVSHVSEFLRKNSEKYQQGDSELFRNFEPKVYTVWNFDKATNEVRHFGNIPPEVLDNLLYYYTQPFDVVFDPFAGGGMALDVCAARLRRCYASDLTPIPARAGQIRAWDITTGLPDDLPVPDFVFLDPPYWKQAEGKYSTQPTDLANIELNAFITAITELAKQVKRKWGGNRPNGKLALIIGPYKEDGAYTDLALLCHQAIAKYLNLVIRIQVPYSTQVHGGAYVKNAKETKQMLYLSRDLMVFGP